MGRKVRSKESPLHGVTVRPAELSDCYIVASNMRQADVAECWAVAEIPPLEAVLMGFHLSDECHTVEVDGEPVALFGVTPPTPGPRPPEDSLPEELPENSFPLIGFVWLLGTPKIFDISKTFLRWSKDWLKHVGRNYDGLMNYVDARNEVHIRWLTWVGFDFVVLHPNKGVHGEAFWEFIKLTC